LKLARMPATTTPAAAGLTLAPPRYCADQQTSGTSGDLPTLSICRLEARQELLMKLRQHTDDPAFADFSCPICWETLWQPVRTSCGHAFCEECLMKAVLAQLGQPQADVSCPLCRHPLNVDDVAADVELVSRMLLVLRKHCNAAMPGTPPGRGRRKGHAFCGNAAAARGSRGASGGGCSEIVGFRKEARQITARAADKQERAVGVPASRCLQQPSLRPQNPTPLQQPCDGGLGHDDGRARASILMGLAKAGRQMRANSPMRPASTPQRTTPKSLPTSIPRPATSAGCASTKTVSSGPAFPNRPASSAGRCFSAAASKHSPVLAGRPSSSAAWMSQTQTEDCVVTESPAPSAEEAIAFTDNGGPVKHPFKGLRSSRTQDGRPKEGIDCGRLELCTAFEHQVSTGSRDLGPSREGSVPVAATSITHSAVTMLHSAASPEGMKFTLWAARPTRQAAATAARRTSAGTASCRSQGSRARSAAVDAQAVPNRVDAVPSCNRGVGLTGM